MQLSIVAINRPSLALQCEFAGRVLQALLNANNVVYIVVDANLMLMIEDPNPDVLFVLFIISAT